ncbi:putative delta(3,5)-Delta(2,4)-dienoyl-CoA isomerase, mitochondrial [Iris pallida]|uniref:Delta(3,5)-Delta(2,4)-dienoyl-CoA isomerase, mitochondrial n=1 Tax=Iris pallida TaxID=29817 RepID=A0AAX6E6R0_IRIPA|nr:putative delta(3,5)-Delta(2,4)-dienoyl-CoA isomerase, mitochondrial [Iris pallida]KAJ6799718.1 putative delta(3,5)-Delta(2,4)-dienoyl-CoA isomerase, mitochondrial [Iris pallida]KAJ6841327.1 putative delta(3,5)-Delta(2,4)-dienoyl-CoA isomerase, mitochondrial [Iris pallida]
MASMTEAEIEAELQKGFSTIEVVRKHPSSPVYHIYLNSPSHRNALPLPFFLFDLPRALSLLDALPSARSIVLSARGPHFCSGIHLPSLSSAISLRTPHALHRNILSMQSAITSLETLRKPVIASIHGACIGAGVDLVSACDIRYCTSSSFFSVKEVDLALAADLGTLQRLPRIVGYGNAIEMALTGRRVGAEEARGMGLVTRVWEGREEMEREVDAVAREMAEKSVDAVSGTKAVMLRSRDLSVGEGLEYVATWNTAMLRGSEDLEEAVKAQMEKRKPVFKSKI